MSTPGNIPSSSSIANLTLSGHDRSHDVVSEELQNLAIYQDLQKYENTIQELSKSVDTFKPDLQLVGKLIECDKNLYSALDEFEKYYKIDEELKQLDEEQKVIDANTKNILETLDYCYSALTELPMLEQVEFEQSTMLKQQEKIHSKVVLDYAMKLAKFTRFPPTFDKAMIGPNNFIWPAEDSLRKGMLAMASLKQKEMLGAALEDDTTEISADPNVGSSSITGQDRTSDIQEANQPDKSTYEFTANGKRETEHNTEEGGDLDLDLDLDLFNPDEF